MGFPADYHMHTPLCRHATGDPVDLAARAVELGLTEIGFSDHNPMPEDDFDTWRMPLRDLDEYVKRVELARRQFPELTIKLAMEVDYLPGCEEWVQDLAGRYPWDYFIGSVHYVSRSFAIDDPSQIGQWRTRDAMEIWTAYFERLTMAAKSGLFEIIGHTDLCKKFCFYPKEDHLPLVSAFLGAARKHDVAIELNTAGLRKDCKEIYPSQKIVDLAAKIGVPITFGSDAHAPEEVGMNFSEALASARDAGYTHWCGFTRRKRHLVAL
jgi:histidinol-phosphatase (PHP family)